MELQELAHAKKVSAPVYSLIEQTGSDHDPIYKMKVEIKEFGKGIGVGQSKHIASRNAAIDLLKKIR